MASSRFSRTTSLIDHVSPLGADPCALRVAFATPSRIAPANVLRSGTLPLDVIGIYGVVTFTVMLKDPDTVGEITTRRQKPLVLRIMVEQGRTMILFLSGLTPRCEQIFPHRCCFQPVRRFRQRCRTPFSVPSRCRSTDRIRRSRCLYRCRDRLCVRQRLACG